MLTRKRERERERKRKRGRSLGEGQKWMEIWTKLRPEASSCGLLLAALNNAGPPACWPIILPEGFSSALGLHSPLAEWMRMSMKSAKWPPPLCAGDHLWKGDAKLALASRFIMRVFLANEQQVENIFILSSTESALAATFSAHLLPPLRIDKKWR